MSTQDEFMLMAAIINKLGGEVTIYPRDIQDAVDLELARWDDPASGGVRFTTRQKPVELIGEIVDDEPRALPGGAA